MAAATWVALLLSVWTGLVAGAITPDPGLKAKYSFSLSLDEDENYWMFWSVDHSAGIISFAVQVNSPGWVGLGLSPDGRMPNSDIVTGWVNDGKGYLQDRFSTGKSRPPIDDSQDVELVSSSEAIGITTLEFKRSVDACESKDRTIEVGTSRMIWSYNPEDPAGNSPDAIQFHTKMGWRSVNLLSGTGGNDVPLPADVQQFDVFNYKVAIPSDETTYWCKSFVLPIISDGAQIVGFDPLIEQTNQGFVHHILVYRCNNATGFRLDHDGICGANMPDEVARCRGTAPVAAWAIGGGSVRYPADVGYPFSGGGLQTVVMETHYDNPEGISGLVDSSGIRLYYTKTKRKYEAAVFEVGHPVDNTMFFPPGEKDVELNNLCPAQCTQAGLPDGGVTVFGSFLHAHTAGRKLKLRHYRNGKELTEIDRNDNYDFNFQDYIYPIKEVKILPGDTLQAVCNYNTEGRSNVTVGGLGSADEMCLVYVIVYPAPKLHTCFSSSPAKEWSDFITLIFTKSWATYYGHSTEDEIIKGLNTLNMSIPEARTAYDNYLNSKSKSIYCLGEGYSPILPRGYAATLPTNFEPKPTDPPPVCVLATTPSPADTTPAPTEGANANVASFLVFLVCLIVKLAI